MEKIFSCLLDVTSLKDKFGILSPFKFHDMLGYSSLRSLVVLPPGGADAREPRAEEAKEGEAAASCGRGLFFVVIQDPCSLFVNRAEGGLVGRGFDGVFVCGIFVL